MSSRCAEPIVKPSDGLEPSTPLLTMRCETVAVGCHGFAEFSKVVLAKPGFSAVVKPMRLVQSMCARLPVHGVVPAVELARPVPALNVRLSGRQVRPKTTV
jgi:hypothetical protein